VAVRILSHLYVGVSVGSWQTEATAVGVSVDGLPRNDLRSAIATAVNGGLYAQDYPVHRTGLFVRGGLGFGQTRTYYPEDIIYIVVQDHTRMAISGGLGTDIPIRRHLAATLSADYSRLLGVANDTEELRSALLVGLGITIH
jgi:hypothetical protein